LGNPVFPVILGQNGLIFGTAFYNDFEFDTATKTMTALNSYDDGQIPTGVLLPDEFGNLYGTTHISGNRSGLVFGKDGRLYGATYFGGTYGYGTIFAIAP